MNEIIFLGGFCSVVSRVVFFEGFLGLYGVFNGFVVVFFPGFSWDFHYLKDSSA